MPLMPRQRWAPLLLFVAAWSLTLGAESPLRADGTGKPPVDDLSSLLAESVKKHKLPGMAAAIVVGGRITALGAAGVRVRGHQERITTDDLFHIGSDTKSMTATLIAILIEEGKLRWNSTPAEVLAGHGIQHIDPAWKRVTLEELLSHHAGVRPNPDDKTLESLVTLKPREQRLRVCRTILEKPPDHAPGKDFLYSNAGYIIAGAMAEAVTDQAWEDLMIERVFKPLGMQHAGFGPPGQSQQSGLSQKGAKPSSSITQPWGHEGAGAGIEPGPEADNPPSLGPAGRVHLTLSDWARYATLHLSAEHPEAIASTGGRPLLPPPLLPMAQLRHLHTPFGGPIDKSGAKYAMGWGVISRGTPGQIELTHAGSNGMWYADISLRMWENRAILIVTNQGNEAARRACAEVGRTLVKHSRSGAGK
jgi:CubicO group peptidase (beta-lactamase class C family)